MQTYDSASDPSRLGSYFSDLLDPRLSRFMSSLYGDGWQPSAMNAPGFPPSGRADIRGVTYSDYPGTPIFLHNLETPTARPFVTLNGLVLPGLGTGTGAGTGGGGIPGPQGPQGPAGADGAPGSGSLIRVSNQSGGDIKAGRVVRANNVTIGIGSGYDPENHLDESYFVVEPDGTDQTDGDAVIIPTEDIGDGNMGWAVSVGLTWAWIDFQFATAESTAFNQLPFALASLSASTNAKAVWVPEAVRILGITDTVDPDFASSRLCLVELDNHRNGS